MSLLPPGDVYLDTSALIDLKTKPDESFARLRSIMREQRRLVVPLVALHEVLSHLRPDVAYATIDMLERLLSEFKCTGGEALQETVALERRGVRIASAPTFDLRELLMEIRDRFSRSETREALVADIVRFLGKERTFEIDRSHAPSFREALPEAVPEDLREIRSNLRRWVSYSHFFRVLVPSKLRQEARRRPKAFRASIMGSAMHFVQALSAGFNGWTKPIDVREIFPDVKRNDYVDMRIVCESAYARVFVSSDRTQSARVGEIANAFGFPLRTATLRA